MTACAYASGFYKPLIPGTCQLFLYDVPNHRYKITKLGQVLGFYFIEEELVNFFAKEIYPTFFWLQPYWQFFPIMHAIKNIISIWLDTLPSAELHLGSNPEISPFMYF